MLELGVRPGSIATVDQFTRRSKRLGLFQLVHLLLRPGDVGGRILTNRLVLLNRKVGSVSIVKRLSDRVVRDFGRSNLRACHKVLTRLLLVVLKGRRDLVLQSCIATVDHLSLWNLAHSNQAKAHLLSLSLLVESTARVQRRGNHSSLVRVRRQDGWGSLNVRGSKDTVSTVNSLRQALLQANESAGLIEVLGRHNRL